MIGSVVVWALITVTAMAEAKERRVVTRILKALIVFLEDGLADIESQNGSDKSNFTRSLMYSQVTRENLPESQ